MTSEGLQQDFRRMTPHIVENNVEPPGAGLADKSSRLCAALQAGLRPHYVPTRNGAASLRKAAAISFASAATARLCAAASVS